MGNKVALGARIAFYPTCLVDIFRPSITQASAQLLRTAGYVVELPVNRTCCGQPGYNAGENKLARQVARKTILELEAYDAIIVPSASCAGMMKHHYVSLCSDSESVFSKEYVERFASKIWELTDFMCHHLAPSGLEARMSAQVVFHENCSALREMKIGDAPQRLLRKRCGIEAIKPEGSSECCGFGGAFCVKYSQISAHMADKKLQAFMAAGGTKNAAEPVSVVTTDLGCLLHLAGRSARRKLSMHFFHIAEVLAGIGYKSSSSMALNKNP